MKNLNSVLVIMIFLVIACKCSSSSDSTTPGKETKPTESADSGSMEYLLNGEKITAPCQAFRTRAINRPDILLTVNGTDKSKVWSMGFTLNADSAKSYTLSPLSGPDIFEPQGSVLNKTEQPPNHIYVFQNGEVTITSVDGEGGGKVSGSFNGVAVNNKDKTLKITDGKFINCQLQKGIVEGRKP